MTNLNNNAAVSPRTTVRIPTASGDELEAWLYLPERAGPHPAVVMAHGIGGIKAGGLAPFAERFREEGFVAIAFDYRNFGGSGGRPREVLSVPRRRADYSTVIGWAVEQPYVDPHQIIAWGTSFAGMHIVELAVSDTRLAAAIAQSPLTDGLAAAMMSTLKDGSRIPHWLCSTVLALCSVDSRSTSRSRNARGSVHRRHAGRPIRGEAYDPEGWDDMARPGGCAVSAQLLLASTSATRCLRAYPTSACCPRGRRHCARPARPRGRSQSTRGRIVLQRRWSLRRLRRRSELRQRAAKGGRFPPPPREDRSPKDIPMILPDQWLYNDGIKKSCSGL